MDCIFIQGHIFPVSVRSNPASLASEIAIVGNGNKLESRKQQSLFPASPEPDKAFPSAPDHIDQEFAPAFTVRLYKIAV